MTTYTAVVMAAPCPKCHQPARSRCVKPSGQQRLEPHTARVPGVVVAAPSVCPTCKGDRVLLGHVGALVQYERPCPACCCHVCGEPTDTPPECRACATGEKS